MAYVKPTITPFNCFDANDAFIIELVGNISSDRFTEYGLAAWGNKLKKQLKTQIINSSISAKDYMDSHPDIISQANTVMVYYNYNYYLILPKNYCVNGFNWQMEISFYAANTVYYSVLTSFGCYSRPIIALMNCVYQDGSTELITNNKLTIKKSFCMLNFSYTQNEGNNLKYYQFFLYHNGKLVGSSKKIYSSAQISYGIENYNNLQDYVLKLHCISQCDYEDWLEININTDYSQDSIYADIAFALDKQTATNNVSISIKQLNGTGDNYAYDKDVNGDYVIIPDNGFVNFLDEYQAISKNFLCRLWCKNLSTTSPILTITTTDGLGYVEVYFTGQNFYAYKHSFGLTSSYISNNLDISQDELGNTNIYFALGYYDGRIEMYTQSITE